MHMHPVDVHARVFYNTQHVRHLVNADAKLRVDMTYRNIGISTRHNMRVDADTNRHRWMRRAKLLQHSKVVYVDLYAKRRYFFNFCKRNTIGSIDDFFWWHSGFKTKLHFLYGYGVQSCAQVMHPFEYAEVRKRFDGIVDTQLRYCAKRVGQSVVLRFHGMGVIYVCGTAMCFAYLY